MFSIRLKDLRENRGLSQQAFANKFGISQSTVGMWESGKREPNFATIQKIADFFETSIDYILGNDTISAVCNENMFSERLKTLRKNASLTQTEIAKNLKISQQAYANYETGKRHPDQEMLKKIADFFDVSVDYLLGRVEKGTNTETEEYLELLRTRPEMKMLFNTTKNATKEEIEKAVAVIEALLGK